MRLARVRVPASTANLGSGFDTLGMALTLYNEVELTDEGEGVQLLVEGEGKSAQKSGGSQSRASGGSVNAEGSRRSPFRITRAANQPNPATARPGKQRGSLSGRD